MSLSPFFLGSSTATGDRLGQTSPASPPPPAGSRPMAGTGAQPRFADLLARDTHSAPLRASRPAAITITLSPSDGLQPASPYTASGAYAGHPETGRTIDLLV